MAFNRLWRDRERKKIVVLDTSALMMPFEFSIDLDEELFRLLGHYHVVVPKPVVNELKFLSEHGKGRKRFIARPALELVTRYDVAEVDVADSVDDAVFQLAEKLNAFVVTNDRELRNRLKKTSLKTIYLRGKKRLMIE